MRAAHSPIKEPQLKMSAVACVKAAVQNPWHNKPLPT
jgi:hypothetical protein